ncbi:hypothetical protein ACFQHN_22580 [Natrialbaceae archaeon GCM10025896]
MLTLDSESSGEWMTRVPAERRAVLQEQRLWRVPDNWERFARVANEHGPDELLFYIPESGVYLVLLDLEHGGAARAGYRVETLGQLVVKTELPDKSALTELLRRIENSDDDDIATAVIDALQLLSKRWDHFESSYRMYYDKWSDERAWNAFKYHDDVIFESWSIEPWDNRQTVGHFIDEVCQSTPDVSRSVNDLLMEAGVVSPSPTVTISLQDRRFPIGYRVQALVEAGCSPGEAVDYLIERFEDNIRASWESIREADESTTRENVRAARDALYS